MSRVQKIISKTVKINISKEEIAGEVKRFFMRGHISMLSWTMEWAWDYMRMGTFRFVWNQKKVCLHSMGVRTGTGGF